MRSSHGNKTPMQDLAGFGNNSRLRRAHREGQFHITSDLNRAAVAHNATLRVAGNTIAAIEDGLRVEMIEVGREASNRLARISEMMIHSQRKPGCDIGMALLERHQRGPSIEEPGGESFYFPLPHIQVVLPDAL